MEPEHPDEVARMLHVVALDVKIDVEILDPVSVEQARGDAEHPHWVGHVETRSVVTDMPQAAEVRGSE